MEGDVWRVTYGGEGGGGGLKVVWRGRCRRGGGGKGVTHELHHVSFCYRGHTSYITCITISDIFVVSGSADDTIRKWDMSTCECLFVFKGELQG